MKLPLLLLFGLLTCFMTEASGQYYVDAGMARCTGSFPCRACKSCEYCQHCNSGGHCGVCGSYRSSRQKTTYAIAPAIVMGKAKVTTHILNLRKGPGTHFEVLTQVHKSDLLEVLEIQKDWAKVRVIPANTQDNQQAEPVEGWCATTYLKQ